MSLFGKPAGAQPGASSNPFGTASTNASPFGLGSGSTSGSAFGTTQNQQKPNPFGGSTFGQSSQQAPSNQFGAQQSTPSAFGGNQKTSSLFGGGQSTSSGFGGLGQQAQQSQIGGQQPSQPTTSFGSTNAFGGNAGQPPATGGLGGGLGGGIGASTQQQQGQQSQFGQTTMVQPQPQQKQPSLSSSLWSPGRAITGVHRTVPEQMQIVGNKWYAPNENSPFRAYIHNHVGEENAPFFQPGPEDDAKEWEQSLRKRPGPGYVPVLVKGFLELGKRAQRQKDFFNMLQARLHEINTCLTNLLSNHDLTISVRIANCRRKHLALSKRCLSLAAKTQVMRNRGYAMDDAEEELKVKLMELDKAAGDPVLLGRLEQVWPRLMSMQEQSRMLQEKLNASGADNSTGAEELDENTFKTAKKILGDYLAQIEHLQKELDSVKKDFDESQKYNGN